MSSNLQVFCQCFHIRAVVGISNTPPGGRHLESSRYFDSGQITSFCHNFGSIQHRSIIQVAIPMFLGYTQLNDGTVDDVR